MLASQQDYAEAAAGHKLEQTQGLERQEIDIAPSIRAVLQVAQDSQLDAGAVARTQRIAQRLGLPDRMVAADLRFAQQEELASRMEANPKLAAWAAKDEFKAAWSAGNLDQLEAILKKQQEDYNHLQLQRRDLSLPRRMLKLLEEGTADVALGLDGFIAGITKNLAENEIEGPVRDALMQRADSREGFIRDYLQNGPQRLEAATALGGYVQDIARQLPQLASQVAMFMGAGGLSAAALMGSQIAGGSYTRLRERGIDPATALQAGVANAVVQTPLEYIGAKQFVNLVFGKATKNMLAKTLKATATESITEFAQEYPEALTDIWAKVE